MTLKLYFMKCPERKISQCILPFTNAYLKNTFFDHSSFDIIYNDVINMRNLALDSAETQLNNFENLKANLSTDIFTDEASDSDINFYNKKPHELDSEYYSQ